MQPRSTLPKNFGSALLMLCMGILNQAASGDDGAASATGAENPDVAAVRRQAEAFEKAFNRGDVKAVVAFWTLEGEYVDDLGRRFEGRAAIAEGYEKFFAKNPKANLQTEVESIRPVSKGLVIEDSTAIVRLAPDAAPIASRYTAVHVNQNGKWLIASIRDERAEVPAEVQSSTDLNFLVGDWVAEEHGVRMESSIKWIAGDRFLERRYTTTQLDGSTTSGVQLIGWNPLALHVQSWDFSPDGGHAVGRWLSTDAGWQAEVYGVTGEGIATSAVITLQRLDDNAYVWQSTQRTLGDVSVPDTGEIVIRRQTTP